MLNNRWVTYLTKYFIFTSIFKPFEFSISIIYFFIVLFPRIVCIYYIGYMTPELFFHIHPKISNWDATWAINHEDYV